MEMEILGGLLTVCSVYSVGRTKFIRFFCRIDNVQQSFRIRVNVVTVTCETEGLHYLIGCVTCSDQTRC